jgi:ketosteroid isomerase-like protein
MWGGLRKNCGMSGLAAIFSLMILAAIGFVEARASDAETIAAINEAAAALDKAFEKQDVETVKKLMTPDHVAVTPYYDGVQTVADQIVSLPDLKYGQTVIGEVTVELLDSDAALRTFAAKLEGSFKGRSIPRRVFVSEIWVKHDGTWQEKFYQVTALKHAGSKHGACKGLTGTYLTKNVMKGESGDSFTSRSLISIGRFGLFCSPTRAREGRPGLHRSPMDGAAGDVSRAKARRPRPARPRWISPCRRRKALRPRSAGSNSS